MVRVTSSNWYGILQCPKLDVGRRGSRGEALGRAPTPGTEVPAPSARVPSSQGQKEWTLVSLEWLFNTIQA